VYKQIVQSQSLRRPMPIGRKWNRWHNLKRGFHPTQRTPRT